MFKALLTRIQDARIAHRAAATTRRELANLTRRDLEDIGLYAGDIDRVAYEAGLAAVAEARKARSTAAVSEAQAVAA